MDYLLLLETVIVTGKMSYLNTFLCLFIYIDILLVFTSYLCLEKPLPRLNYLPHCRGACSRIANEKDFSRDEKIRVEEYHCRPGRIGSAAEDPEIQFTVLCIRRTTDDLDPFDHSPFAHRSVREAGDLLALVSSAGIPSIHLIKPQWKERRRWGDYVTG